MTVHFQAISEKFTPHDTVYSFTSSADLRDNALSRACSLHTASASIKSSNSSLRQRNLAEITEDVEELSAVPGPTANPVNESNDDSIMGRSSSIRNGEVPTLNALGDISPILSSRKFRDTMKALPPTPFKSEEFKDISTYTEIPQQYPRDSEASEVSLDSRPSTSTRPPNLDYYFAYDYKPKVKLGPRPSLEASSKPQSGNHYRPTSSLPPGIQMPIRKPVPARLEPQTLHTPSRYSISSRGSTVIAPPPTPKSTSRIPERPSTSQSNRTITKSIHADSKTGGMTPEKRRLLKAVQIRQKQLAAQAAATESASASTSLITTDDARQEPHDQLGRPKTEIYSPTRDAQNEVAEPPQSSPGDRASYDNEIKDPTDFVNPEASPISAHDVSDEASTKPSSLSSEDESDLPQKQSPATLSDPKPEKLAIDVDVSDKPTDASASSGESTVIAVSPDIETADNESAMKNEQLPQRSSPTSLDGALDLAAEEKPAISTMGSAQSINPSPEHVYLPPVDEEETAALKERPIPSTMIWDQDEQSAPSRPSTGVTRPSTGDITGTDNGYVLGKGKSPGSLKRVSSPAHSEDHFLSDDSFLEELGSATVQVAKPISVSKSPIASVFPRSYTDSGDVNARSVSMPHAYIERNPDVPVPEIPRLLSPRTVSATHSPNPILPQATPSLKKLGVSSGISQRIKALEKISNRPASPGTQNASSLSPTSTTAFPAISSRKTSLRSRPSMTDDQQTPNAPPVIEKFFVVPEHSKASEANAVSVHSSAKHRPDPICVEATAESSRVENVTKANEQRSPIHSASSAIFKKPIIKRHLTSPSASFNGTADKRRSDSFPAPKRDSIISRLSSSANISRRGSEAEIPRSPSESSLLSGSTSLGPEDGRDGDRKESRRSKLLKRMSNLSSVSRKSIISALSPPVKEEPIFERREQSVPVVAPEKTPDVILGDVNVQFPDSLVSQVQ